MTNHVAQEGGRLAFEELLRAALPVISQRLTRRYGDPQLAEEVSWDCLTQAYEVWRRDPHFFESRDLTAWSSQRACWRVLDRLRERGRFASLAEEHGQGEESEAFGLPLADPGNEECVRQLLSDRQLTWECLEELDEQDREILLAYYYDNLTDQEIGTRLYGCEGSEQARGLRVWRRRQKAHDRLRTLLERHGIDVGDSSPVTHQAV